jgi:long-subunit acyl-CoA synthetase (AMP-forming)
MNEEHFQYIYKKLAPELIINSKNIIEITKCNVKKQFNITFANSFILLTSGTTNLPKIVEFNGESVYAQLLLARDIIKKSWLISNFKQIEKIKLLMFLPLHHVFGLMANYL